MIIDTRPDSAPTDRSRSPLVSGTSSAIVSTNSTACEPKMFEKFPMVRNWWGEWIPKPTMTAIQARGSIALSSSLARRERALAVGVATVAPLPVPPSAGRSVVSVPVTAPSPH